MNNTETTPISAWEVAGDLFYCMALDPIVYDGTTFETGEGPDGYNRWGRFTMTVTRADGTTGKFRVTVEEEGE